MIYAQDALARIESMSVELDNDREVASPHTAIWCATFVIVMLCYIVGALVAPPAMYTDSGWGFAAWRSMQHGSPFNEISQADPENIANDASHFMTWWTPGQYLIPGSLTTLGLPLGVALTITTALFSVLGLFGWFQVYRAFGFNDSTAWASCGVILTLRFFVLPFGIYNGGEVLLFGGGPFLILGGLWAADVSWSRAIALIPLFLLAFVLKNSALVFALAVCVAIVLWTWQTASGKERFIGWLRWPLVFLITYFITYLLHTSRGPTPIAFAPNGVGSATGKGVFVIAGPFLSSLSIDEFLSWLLLCPARPLLPDWQLTLPVIIPLALIAATAYWWIGHQSVGTKYGTWLAAFIGTYVAVFAVLSVLGAAVSATTEARHFRPAGLVFLPGLVAAIGGAPRWIRAAGIAVLLFASLYGLSSYANRWQYLKNLNSVGTQWVTQTSLDQETLQWLIQIDANAPPGTAIYLPSPELAIEVNRSRLILADADFDSSEQLSSRVYRGKVEHLFIVLPERFASSGKAQLILAAFRDYQRWKSTRVGTFRVYQGDSTSVQSKSGTP